jgi:ABC-type nitrate/sulfonate/bicarbonate transport system substrate-binding protein
MMKRIRPKKSIALLVSFAFVLAACGTDDNGDDAPDEPETEEPETEEPDTDEPESDDDPAEGDEEEPEAESEPLAISMTSAASLELVLPLFVAEGMGAYEDDNLEIDLTLASGQAARTSLITGEVEMAMLGFSLIPVAQQAGEDVRVVATAHEKGIFSLLVRSELEGEVNEIADLEGRVVAFAFPGAGSWAYGLGFLDSAGLNPDTDVEYTSIGSADPGVHYSTLESGAADALITWQPTASRVIADGIAFPLVPIWDEEVHREVLGSDTSMSMTMGTMASTIEEDPEMVQRVVDAYMAGLEYIGSHSPEEIYEVSMQTGPGQELLGGLDEELAIEIIELLQNGFGTGCLSEEAYLTEMNLTADFGVADFIDYADATDDSFAGAC